jgi:hypothetical protein
LENRLEILELNIGTFRFSGVDRRGFYILGFESDDWTMGILETMDHEGGVANIIMSMSFDEYRDINIVAANAEVTAWLCFGSAANPCNWRYLRQDESCEDIRHMQPIHKSINGIYYYDFDKEIPFHGVPHGGGEWKFMIGGDSFICDPAKLFSFLCLTEWNYEDFLRMEAI